MPWFQEDRGADCGQVLLGAHQLGVLFTVRAAHDRRIMDPEQWHQLHLWERVRSEPAQGGFLLQVPAGKDRQERVAVMTLRFFSATLTLRDGEGQKVQTQLWAVQAREVGSTPLAEQPIEWLLLTNYEVLTLQDARLVVLGYSQRWRIEQFHRLWKSEACHVEDSQLRSLSGSAKESGVPRLQPKARRQHPYLVQRLLYRQPQCLAILSDKACYACNRVRLQSVRREVQS